MRHAAACPPTWTSTTLGDCIRHSAIKHPLQSISRKENHPLIKMSFCCLDKGVHLRIFLKAGTYNIANQQTIQASRIIKIYGVGSEATIIDSNTTNSSLFQIMPGGTLELYAMTLTGGSVGTSNYGGIAINYGTLNINKSVLRDNSAVNGGGAILTYNNASSAITDSILLRNTTGVNGSSGGGGAIQNQGSMVTLRCLAFDSNKAGYGGAILNTWDTISGSGFLGITESRFNGNIGTSGNAGAIFNRFPNNATANNNWWPFWAWAGGFPAYDNTQYPNTDTIDNVTIASVATSDPLISVPTSCKVKSLSTLATNPPPPLTVAEALYKHYGVLIANTDSNGNVPDWNSLLGWSTTERDQMWTGVQDTAIALAILSNRDPIDAFEIMRRPGTDTGATFLTLQKSGSGASCLSSPNPSPSTIVCGTGTVMSKYTMTHELGHFFLNRTGGFTQGQATFFGRMNNPVDESCPNQPAGSVYDNTCRDVVFGYAQNTNFQTEWQRGERGWGSQTLPLPNPSNFQQDPYSINDFQATQDQKNEEIDEAGADMFLNWVYTKVGEGGFQDTNWRVADNCNTAQGCPDGRNPGTARNNWMDTTMATLVPPLP